jgi:prepilin-type N-terminal cleavage/methylation domain-containing protein/prepilin-type processing-associated H-X9-DG protein
MVILKKRGFTLIELLVVVAIIAILVAILLPSLSKAKSYARKVVCGGNLRQIANALEMYAKDHNGMYPLAWCDQSWDIVEDGPGLYDKMGWMRRLFPYVQQEIKVYKCPSVARQDDIFTYFLGCRAAFVQESRWDAVRQSRIEYPSAFVLGGDCNLDFRIDDCDRDDFTQPCLGFRGSKDVANFSERKWWDPWHDGGLMVIFADSHVKWYTQHVGREMTYSYGEYTDWEGAMP